MFAVVSIMIPHCWMKSHWLTFLVNLRIHELPCFLDVKKFSPTKIKTLTVSLKSMLLSSQQQLEAGLGLGVCGWGWDMVSVCSFFLYPPLLQSLAGGSGLSKPAEQSSPRRVQLSSGAGCRRTNAGSFSCGVLLWVFSILPSLLLKVPFCGQLPWAGPLCRWED